MRAAEGDRSRNDDGFARPHPRGWLILFLGIASLLFFGIILGPIAFYMGSTAIKEIDRAPQAYTNRGIVNAGRLCGAVGGILGLLGLVLVLGSL